MPDDLTRGEAPAPPAGAAGLALSPGVRVAAIAISVLSLTAVALWALRQPAPHLPSSGSELLALGGALAAYAAGTMMRGERWLRLLRRAGADVGRGDAQGLNVVGYMGNNVLPARAGDALRVWLLATRASVPARPAIGTLVAERVLDATLLLTLFCVLAYGVLSGIDAPGGARLAAVAAAIAAVIGIGALLAIALRDHPAVAKVIGFLAPMAASTRALRGRHGAAMVTFTAAIWTLEATTVLAVAGATDVSMDPLEALYLVALASVFLLIPSGPGYAGTLDAAVLFGIGAIGGSGSEAVSYLLVLRCVFLVPITLAGLALLVFRYGGFGVLRRAEAESR